MFFEYLQGLKFLSKKTHGTAKISKKKLYGLYKKTVKFDSQQRNRF